MSKANKEIICHASGDRCHGCAHYRGEADVCEFAESADPLELVTRIYTMGYMDGHEETVEGSYTDVVQQDVDTYFIDRIEELEAWHSLEALID